MIILSCNIQCINIVLILSSLHQYNCHWIFVKFSYHAIFIAMIFLSCNHCCIAIFIVWSTLQWYLYHSFMIIVAINLWLFTHANPVMIKLLAHLCELCHDQSDHLWISSWMSLCVCDLCCKESIIHVIFIAIKLIDCWCDLCCNGSLWWFVYFHAIKLSIIHQVCILSYNYKLLIIIQVHAFSCNWTSNHCIHMKS